MKYRLSSTLAALCAGSLTAAALPQLPTVEPWRKNAVPAVEQTVNPVLKEKSIQFGSKNLLLSPDGKIECMTTEHGSLFATGMYFHVKINGKDDHAWRAKNFDAAKSRFYRKDNAYHWELWYGGKDAVPSFMGVEQILTVLPDGKVKLAARYCMPEPTPTHVFKVYRLSFTLKDSQWAQETLSIDGKPVTLTRDLKKIETKWRQPNPTWVFGATNPTKKFTVQTKYPEMRCFNIFRYSNAERFDVAFFPHDGQKDWYVVYFDLTQGADPKSLGETRGGVNFKMQENMVLPDIHNRNMTTNPSFECGLEGWHTVFMYASKQWDWVPYELDGKTAYDGKYSLKFNAHYTDSEYMVPNLGPLRVIAEPGTYTFSFYAKGEPGKKARIVAWIYDFHRNKWTVVKGGMNRYYVTPEWKRYSFTFSVPGKCPVTPVQFCAIAEKGETAQIWVDAVQLEKGSSATAFERKPVEGYLITGKADNFFSANEKINGKLRINTAKPGAEGKVRITVRNFFGETVLDQTKDFKTTSDCTTELALPLDSLPGLGVFVVKCEYKLKSGEEYYDYRRYAKIEFQDMPRPNKRMFCADYGGESGKYMFRQMLDRWKKLGVGSRFHHPNLDKDIWKMEKQYLDTSYYMGSMLNYIWANRSPDKKSHFCIIDRSSYDSKQTFNDPAILVKDYHLEAGGKVTPEYQAKLKEAVKNRVRKHPHVNVWSIAGELTCKFPNEWWGKGYTDRDVVRTIAMLIKPVAEGVKEVNPNAMVFQDDPSNMSPRGGIAETDLLLEETNKLGIKFDLICIHPYRFSPENPDLDADAQLLFKVLKKHGYGKTKVIWPEGMHWGPFDIPQWGTVSSTWQNPPRTWEGTISYDMGWTEKKSAAWYARAWLVALKYGDRVIGSCAGNCRNNNIMDCRLTPYAAQLIPNTLSCILGDAKFKKDVRFAPYLRTYVFEDAQKRPVAVIWNHHEDVDNGRVEAPYVTVDFGNTLEKVLDLMNSPRKFEAGKMRFQVTPFPLFFVGKPGTLEQMISALEKATPESGSLFKPVSVAAVPVSGTELKLTLKNSLSKEFKGTLNGTPVVIPASGETVVVTKLPAALQRNSIQEQKLNVMLKSEEGTAYSYDLTFSAFKVARVPDNVTIDTLDWSKLSPVRYPDAKGSKISGDFRIGWNKHGFYFESRIKDAKFCHVEYANGGQRWKNDCLQIFIDTLANARERQNKGFDEDDYAYNLYPNSKGDAARMFRYRSVESQLGLATQAPPDMTYADDIPCRFSSKDGVLTYRTFIPAKYLLPVKLQKNCAFGFALYVNNSDEPEKLTGAALTLATDGKGCFNRPHVWPVAVLEE